MSQFTRRIIGFAVHAGAVDGRAFCRMFNRAIRGCPVMPKYLSCDHDPLLLFERWRAHLRILEMVQIKEDFYRRSSEAKTLFLMYEKEDRPVIHKASPKDDCEMLIEVNEKLSGEHIEIPADLVVLMVGMEAREDSYEVSRIVNISQDKDGWFIESHPKLEPVATTTDGIFIAGTCVAPKDIPDSVAQARAAAARVLARISKGKIEVDALYSEVNEENCSGCISGN